MGETVLFQYEVNPAMSAALDAGLEVTALHNRFFFDQPKVYFMRIGGMGETRQLAAGVRPCDRFARVHAAQVTAASTFAGAVPRPSSGPGGPIEQILGTKAQSKDGMVKVVIGPTAEMHGVTVAIEMGVAFGQRFQVPSATVSSQ